VAAIEPDAFDIAGNPDGVAVPVGADAVAVMMPDAVVRPGAGQGDGIIAGAAVDGGAVAAVAVLKIHGFCRLSDPINRGLKALRQVARNLCWK
jgi:hypothetical protein